MTEPKVLLMDEPSRGIDIGAKAEIYRTMRELAAEGIGIIFVTSDLEEVLALSDRIIVMADGRVTGEFATGRSGGRGDCRRDARKDQGSSRMTIDDRNTAPAKATINRNWLLLLLKARTFVALILVLGYFSFAAPNFLSAENAVLVTKHVAINAFLAIGMTFVIITGGIDLSVGSLVGLTAMAAGLAVDLRHRSRPRLVDPVQHARNHADGLRCLGIFVGWINGMLITRLNVAPFIATLGMLYVARGAALLSSGGRTFPNLNGNPDYGSASFPAIGAGNFLGIPDHDLDADRGGCGAAYLAARTPLGRHIYATGGNERGAALSGVNVRPGEVVRLYVLRVHGRAGRADHRQPAPCLAPGDGRILRTQRDRRGGARRHLDVGWARQDRRHDRRRLRHRHPVRRSRDDGCIQLLADGHQRACHYRRRGHRPGSEQTTGARGTCA